jgi:glyoxylase-like metal-dependent hydrolase (beta-lactamase superfamily II)
VSRAEPIDLRHQGTEHVIGVYLVETSDGPALFDCGPSTSIDVLKAGLRERGLELTDLRHLLLSHIHLDHAGAAGTLVREHPALKVHVSPVGAPHLVDPSRLERSARRLYGELFDPLWGELAPVPEENIRPTGDRVLGLDCFPAPGHASHHVCYVAMDGTLYAGDAAGVRIVPGRHVIPASPPPDIDVEAWYATLDEIERRVPDRLALIHYGVVEDVAEHLAKTRSQIAFWTERVGGGMSRDEFVALGRAELHSDDGPDASHTYEKGSSFLQSWDGLERYWRKRRERESGRETVRA